MTDMYPTLYTAHPDGIYRELPLDVVRGWFTAPGECAPSDAKQAERAHSNTVGPERGDSGVSWINDGVAVVDERCPIHGENGVGNCWPCHVAGVVADPESCEPIDSDA